MVDLQKAQHYANPQTWHDALFAYDAQSYIFVRNEPGSCEKAAHRRASPAQYKHQPDWVSRKPLSVK